MKKPVKPKKPKRQETTVRIPATLHREMKHLATDEDCNLNDLVIEGLRRVRLARKNDEGPLPPLKVRKMKAKKNVA